MSLPTISIPTYNITVPSTKQKVKYRPYLVKEEKVLLMALGAKIKNKLQMHWNQ